MSEGAELTVARVAHYPMPGMNAPAAVRFSPDGRLVTYLWSAEGTLVRQLWAFDLATGENRILVRPPGEGDTDGTASAEEALRRERLRMRGFGVTNYAWADRAPALLVPIRGELFIASEPGAPLRKIAVGGEAIDPHLNPDGSAVAYVQEGELWARGLEDGAQPRRLTFDASSKDAFGERTITNGLAEFIAQEEMGRSMGFWWSRDGTKIAYTQVDSSAVPLFVIPREAEHGPDAETHRYPFAGARNVQVKLGVVDATGGPTTWLPLDAGDDFYLARIDWTPDGKLIAQIESRDQRRLDVVRFDPATGERLLLWSEQAETWLNLHDDLRFVQADGAELGDYQVLWSSERTGYRHLYLYRSDGALLRQLTDGEWPVDRVFGSHDGWIYFLAGKQTPLERQAFRVATSGGEVQQLTTEPGMHNAVLSPLGDQFADLWDSTGQAPRLELRRAHGTLLQTIREGDMAEATELGLTPPEFVSLHAADGALLHGALYRPVESASTPAPVIVSVYGGPHVQQVTNSWALTADLRAQLLAREGFAVFKLDNHGSARRGHAFEAAILGDMGNKEVEDQVAGIRFLAALPGLDTSRAGIYGWSYGGYMAVMCLLRAPDAFTAAVGGAPVTDWDGYDTHYTERYMRTPDENPSGYQSSSALSHVAALRGHLLLIHGMIDENVHFRHTARLVSALIQAGKPFELLPFPNERHMPRGEPDRIYMEQRLIDHFRAHLLSLE